MNNLMDIVLAIELIICLVWIVSLIRREIRAHQYDKHGISKRVHREAMREALRLDRERFVVPALQIVNEYLARKEGTTGLSAIRRAKEIEAEQRAINKRPKEDQ